MDLRAHLVATSNTAKWHPQHRKIEIGIHPSKKGKMDEYWMGRHQDADFVLMDGTVSRKHACLKYCTSAWNILDNGSSNGIMLNRKFIPKSKYVSIAYGDRIMIVNNANNFEWEFQLVAAEGHADTAETVLLNKKKVDERHRFELTQVKEEKLNLEQKVFEIEKQKKQLEDQKQEMLKTLSEERKSFADKQASELTKFEDEMKVAKQEAVLAQKSLFEQRLRVEKKVAEEKLAEKEKELTKAITGAETRIDNLIDEKDNIIISLEFEMEQNKQKVEEMKIRFDQQLMQLELDRKNEKATIQEHKAKIDDLKRNFDSDLKNNQQEMKEAMARIKSEKEKEQKEKDLIKQQIKERDAEVARLQQELKKARGSGAPRDTIESAGQKDAMESNCRNQEMSAQSPKIKDIGGDAVCNEKLDFLSKCNEELKCSVCDELFIEPMGLGCGHVYCRYCLEQWEINCGNCFAKFNCPNCREPITQFHKSLQLDNLIKSMYKGLSDTLQKEREDLIKERKNEESKAKEKQELEQRQREQEELERRQNRQRGRRNQRRGGGTVRGIREALAGQAQQHRRNIRESQAERRRDLQNRVREMRERLVASEQQNSVAHTLPTSPTTTSRVRATINSVRDRILTEISTRRNRSHDSPSENISEVRPTRRTRSGRTERIQESGRGIYVSAQSTPPPVIDVDISDVTSNGEEGSSDSPRSNRPMTAAGNEWANDPDDAENTVSSVSQSSRSSSSSSSSSTSNSSSTSETSNSSVEGVPGFYYGGYGACFNCGRRGHWTPGCPNLL